jgi:hypothetical protein
MFKNLDKSVRVTRWVDQRRAFYITDWVAAVIIGSRPYKPIISITRVKAEEDE